MGGVSGFSPALLVAIPCLNEVATIREVVAGVPRSFPGVGRVDVLVVNDGSSDGTGQAAAEAGAAVVDHPRNLGVGAAFQTAVDYAITNGYGLMVNMDGDGQFDSQEIGALIAPILERRADMVTGSRFMAGTSIEHMSAVKRIGNQIVSSLVSHVVGGRFLDVSCGFRAYSREALLRLNIHGSFTYTQETFIDLVSKRLLIVEVPITVRYFEGRQSRVAKSIMMYGYRAGMIMLRGYRDYYPMRFFCFLAGVFAVPGAAFALVFLTNFLATGRFTGFLFAGFLASFLLAVALLFLFAGILADMLVRLRVNQERILYHLRKSQ